MAAPRVFVVVVLAVCITRAAAKIRCYTCVSTVNELSCVNDPTTVPNGSPITDCDMGNNECCTIYRQEYLEDPGKVISFSRSCQKDCPPPRFNELPDSSYMIYQTYCNTPLCNIGPGNDGLPGNGGGGGGGDGNNVIGPIAGKDSASSVTVCTALLWPAVAMALFQR